jgi:hypothetical protein
VQLRSRKMAFNRLVGVYERLQKSPVVIDKSLELEHVSKFIEILNEAIPTTIQEANIRSEYRMLMKCCGSKLYGMLQKNGKNHLILLLNGAHIMRHFGIQGFYINYRYEAEEYRPELRKKTFHKKPFQKKERRYYDDEEEKKDSDN